MVAKAKSPTPKTPSTEKKAGKRKAKSPAPTTPLAEKKSGKRKANSPAPRTPSTEKKSGKRKATTPSTNISKRQKKTTPPEIAELESDEETVNKKRKRSTELEKKEKAFSDKLSTLDADSPVAHKTKTTKQANSKSVDAKVT